MDDDLNYEPYLFINSKKFVVSVTTDHNKKVYHDEMFTGDDLNQINFEKLNFFLNKNIFKIEKKLKKFIKKISIILDHHNILRKAFGLTEICADSIVDYLKDIQSQILPFMDNTWRLLNEMRLKDKKVLFEGAQGLLLDIDFGTYPFVTSSNTLPAQAAIGTGVGPKYLDNIIGITKAYTTRVGSGPFPTELFDEIGEINRRYAVAFPQRRIDLRKHGIFADRCF